MMKTPPALRISSAAGVSGAFAPSAISFARTRPAFFSVMAEPPAAGISTSQSASSTASSGTSSPPGKPFTLPVFADVRGQFRHVEALLAEGSRRRCRRPPRPWRPRLAMARAATDPTLPKPCTATRIFDKSRFRCRQAAAMVATTPLPVASRRPTMPPMTKGLPVTKHPPGIDVPSL